ncbi:MAG: dehypoxanthine futalosine cyclase [Candidatus Melainabacteria bacterium]|jgi:cyclic dehypoxanthinyl futalosine synthase|nr:dehypoxanthine futalosine cyclase [Candidatus Melainabacteria bacterium]
MVKQLLQKAIAGGRLDFHEGVKVFNEASLMDIGYAANEVRRRFHPDDQPITYVIDRNVNYTNVCDAYCTFCAFYAPPGSDKGYVLPYETIKEKVTELVDCGGTQLLLQGGHNPDLGIEYYEELLSKLKSDFPKLTLHALSPSEIDHITRTSNLSLEETLKRLVAAGLTSIPGGGAEVLSERVKKIISPLKIPASRWLEVMEAAHKMGVRTTSTMMYGSVDTIEDRIEHLVKLRDLQDRAEGFTAFIAWSFQPGGTPLGKKVKNLTTATEYLRMVAVSRLMLDNIRNIQSSWVTQGSALGQTAFAFGANDFGGTMMEENVVSAAGTRCDVTLDDMIRCIHAAGFDAAQRDTQYNILKLHRRQASSGKTVAALAASGV